MSCSREQLFEEGNLMTPGRINRG